MKPIKGYNSVQASGDYERLAPGGYVIIIDGVIDMQDREYLRIVYDIAEGPEKGRYANEMPENDYRHSFIRSYKETALGMFKAFINAIDETNGTKFNDKIEKGFKESELVGKLLGVVLGYEEYEANDGNVKERLRLVNCLPADKIRKGEFKIPELKKLKTDPTTPVSGFVPVADDDIPFN